MTGHRSRLGVALVALAAAMLVASAGVAHADVTISRAEVNGDRLRIEGSALTGRPITVDGVQMTTSSSSGSFKIERSGYSPPSDCTVDVNDGSAAPASVRLSGCTVAATPAAALASISLDPATVPAGTAASATVTLTAPAPAGGLVVSLTSSNTSAATVAATVPVPAGSTAAATSVATGRVSSTTTSVITAAHDGLTRTATLTVTAPQEPQPGGALDSITLSPSTVQTGTASTSATLAFTAPTPPGGAAVSIASSNTSVATVPASVTVPANVSTGGFSVSISSSAVGTATISATYEGITRSAVLTVSSQSLFRIITTSPLPSAKVGENYAGYIEACCGQGTPYRWSLVSGRVPDGLRFAGNDLRLSRTTAVTGVPTRVETTTFTVRARDQAGNSTTKTFILTVDAASPLVITNGTDQLRDGTVGVAYETGLFPGGGVPPYRWSHVAGTLPPGLSVQASPGRVLGTPSTAGTFTFTVRVDDSSGQFATQPFTIRILP